MKTNASAATKSDRIFLTWNVKISGEIVQKKKTRSKSNETISMEQRISKWKKNCIHFVDSYDCKSRTIQLLLPK